jgi:short-subunit dehydrogenase
MPFLMDVDAFARKAAAAIERGDSYRVFPWQMGLVAKLLRVMPNAVFDALLSGRGRKPRSADAAPAVPPVDATDPGAR